MNQRRSHTARINCIILACCVVVISQQQSASARKPERKATGIEKRVPWTTSRVQGTPDPPRPYRTQLAFPDLKFTEPLEVTQVPGTKLLGVAERGGVIYLCRAANKHGKTKLIDVGRVVYGLAFHPKFATNGQFFVSTVKKDAPDLEDGSWLIRFTAKRTGETWSTDPKSAEVLLKWPSGGHNGGCLRFGPDGYLYMATGDGSGIADLRKTGQDVSDLLGSILRIDVNRPTGTHKYSNPPDNPFVGKASARPEIYSYGHRQVWKFSFDRMGQLWAGEVGQDLWEMIYLVQKGGNYGWSVSEGNHPFRPARAKGPTPILKPLIEHSHNDFRSITGGYVYEASRLKELRGHYIYGDYDTGRVWGLRYSNGKVTQHRELVDTQFRVVAFAQAHDGEVYVLDWVGGQLHRLVRNPPSPANTPKFPRKLSETGLFASTARHTPKAGVIPYSVNAPLWSDGAVKDRFLALPGTTRIEYNDVTYPQPAPGSRPGWRFPDGTVLVKTFSLDLKEGDPTSRRRLETRILHHERLVGDDDSVGTQVWHGYTYVWNDKQTDAELLDSNGLDRTFTVTGTDGSERKQKWHFPSRAECTLCHTMSAKYVLGLNTLQANRDHVYGDAVANQLDTFSHIGLFTKPLEKTTKDEERLIDYRDESEPLDQRARSYLHANCSHCHRKWGGGNAEFQLLASQALSESGTINVAPGQGKFGLADARILAPGDPQRSMVLHRMKLQGLGRMPHVASNVIDKDAVKLIANWIKSLK